MSTVAILGAGELGAAIARRLAERRVLSVVEIALEPVDRVAFDAAAQRRFAFAHEALSKSLPG